MLSMLSEVNTTSSFIAMAKELHTKFHSLRRLATYGIVKTLTHAQQNKNTIEHLLKNTPMLKVGGKRYQKPFIT